jgi:predicted O-linked N-acetylglucosamine transferase (SPINDLY family)
LDDYREIAVALALNSVKRKKLRARLLAAMDSQPLFDPKTFTSDWERSLKMYDAAAPSFNHPL